MSIDSEAKRKSSTHLLMSFYPQLILVDGTIGQADRMAAAWWYNGIMIKLPSVGIFLTFVGKTLGLTFSEEEPGITMTGNSPGITIQGDRG